MLKFLMVLCIIYFQESTPRLVGDYHQLILVQQSPITAFFTALSSSNTTSSANLEYLRQHSMIFDPQVWIVRGLWPIDANGHNLTKCQNSTGTSLTYQDHRIGTILRGDLRLGWPVLLPDEIEEDLWEKEYNMYGSCVTALETDYFYAAVMLLDIYNIGEILFGFDITPGSSYPLEHILNSLTEIIRKRFFVKCLPTKHPKKQYFLEVRLCFNLGFNSLINCHPSFTHECDPNKEVIYPGSSAGLTH